MEKTNATYKAMVDSYQRDKQFQERDSVMVLLRNWRFSIGTYNKQKLRKHGPFKVIKWINNNIYIIDLQTSMGISSTFNLANSYEFNEDDEPL